MGGHGNLTFKASQIRRDQSCIPYDSPVIPLFAPKLSEKVLRKGGNCPEKWGIFAKISNALFPYFAKNIIA